MKVLVACEKSGVVRRALRAAGVDAWSCDIEPSVDGSPWHIQADALRTLTQGSWAGMIAHPECRFLSASGLHWNTRPGYEWRQAETDKALAFALSLWAAPVSIKILENPRGKLGKALAGVRRVITQPYEHGDDASKETHFWYEGKEMGPLVPALRVPGRIVDGKERWANQTNTGQNRLGPSADRSAKRAETYPGVAAWLARSVAAALRA